MKTTIRRLILTAIVTLGMAASALAQPWPIDPDHSAAHFSIRHMMIAQVRGMFPDVKGTIAFENGTPTAFDVTIGVDSLDTGVDARDTHLKSDDFFSAKTYPTMTFESSEVFKVQNGYRVAGTMTIKGVSRRMELIVNGLDDPRNDPWGNVRRGGTGLFNLDRKDFDITWNAPLDGGGLMIGNEVDIAVDLEVIQPK